MGSVPTYEDFAKLAANGSLIPIHRRLLSDSLTPVSAFAKLDNGGPGFLFESVVGGEKVGRYSFLGSGPFQTLEAWGSKVVCRDASGETVFDSPNPLAELQRRVHAFRLAGETDLPPFVGGAIGYAAYDAVRYTERLPHAPLDDRGLPDLSFGFYDQLVIFDNVQKTMIPVVLANPAQYQGDLRKTYDAACQKLEAMKQRLTASGKELPNADISKGGPVTLPYTSNFSQSAFEDMVKRCVEYIKAGDIFQVVVSQRLELPLKCSPFEVYRTLRVVNPSPFMFFLRTSSCTLVGSSPEVMVRVLDGEITVRPLAGTRPRGATAEEDQRLAQELLADPKERAEHVMLVDLGRNDVGRLAKYGSVKVTDLMTIERYSHVMHITSHVTGELREDKDAFDALRSCLPAGTVSGAPKVRAMEIIDEQEPHRRGPYAGAVGYFDFRGNMDTCIALRTLVVKDGTAYVQAGAGIVADSDPACEYQETLNKARGLLRAIELTQKRVAEGQ